MTIYALEVNDPKNTVVDHWKDVPFLAKAEKFEFVDGVNIIFGPNGSGKSTLLEAIARLTHCKDSGLPTVTRDSVRDFMGKTNFRDPPTYKDGLVLKSDGQPTRFISPDLTLGRWGSSSIDEDFGMEQIQQMFSRRSQGSASSGERMVREIARIAFSECQEVRYRIKKDRVSDQKLWEVATAGLKGRKRKNRLAGGAMLFDEVERSMDFVNEALWWDKVRHALEHGPQIIMATHSPFALAMDDTKVNFIETEKGYIKKARKAMEAAGWQLRK